MDANALCLPRPDRARRGQRRHQANVFTPGGQIYGNYLQYVINPKGQLLRAEDYKDLIIRYQDGAPGARRDVAKPVDGLQKQYLTIDFWTSWMQPRASSLVVAVTPAPGANDVTVARAVRDTLARLQASRFRPRSKPTSTTTTRFKSSRASTT